MVSDAFPPSEDSGTTATPADALSILKDWMTIWQSELAAIAVDQELQENWQAMMSFWIASAQAIWTAATLASDDRHPAGRRAEPTRADAAARTAAAASASDAGLVAIERLSRRVDELERVLARIERGKSARRPRGRP